MPTDLTDVDAFAAVVSVPVGTDPRSAASVQAPVQLLANRTKFLSRAQQCARYTVPDASGVAADAVVPLAADFEFGGFTLVSNQIQVPAAGVYEVHFQVHVMNDQTNADRLIGVKLVDAGAAVPAQGYERRASTAEATPVLCRGLGLWQVTTPAAQRLALTLNSGGAATPGTFTLDTTVSSTGTVLSFVALRRIR